MLLIYPGSWRCVKDVPGGFPKSDLLGVTVALIHVVLCQLQRQLALWLWNKSVISQLWQKIAHTPWHILNSAITIDVIQLYQLPTFSGYVDSLVTLLMLILYLIFNVLLFIPMQYLYLMLSKMSIKHIWMEMQTRCMCWISHALHDISTIM